MSKALLFLSVALVPALPASADTFTIAYTTVGDATGGPSVTMNATIVAYADPYTGTGFSTPQSYIPTSIVGTRGGVAFSNTDATYFFDNFSEFYFPETTISGYSTFLDGGLATLTYRVAGVDYQLSRNNSTFYLEDASTGIGRNIVANNFTITRAAATVVPEPATWAMMIAGFGMIGAGLRMRRRRPALG